MRRPRCVFPNRAASAKVPQREMALSGRSWRPAVQPLLSRTRTHTRARCRQVRVTMVLRKTTRQSDAVYRSGALPAQRGRTNMENSLEKRIRTAVSDGFKARSAFYAAMDLPDEQQLGSPPPACRLIELETRLGRLLPASYRAFLSMFNGWRMINGATDLLSVEEMLDGRHVEQIRAWQRQAEEAGDEIAARALVIGVAEITPTKILLDPETIATNGEWALIQHHKDAADEYPSFLAWLEASVENFRHMAAAPLDH
jgi:hypothetical protein